MVHPKNPVDLMSNAPAATEATLEVVSPDNTRNHVRVTESPFYIGRGEAGNHIPMHDRRISRRCAAIVLEGSNHYLEDRGHHLGIFAFNGKRVSKKAPSKMEMWSASVSMISYKIVYRFYQPNAFFDSKPKLEPHGERRGNGGCTPGGLGKLNLLLEATRLLHSQLPLDAVLEAMIDRAISITNADHGLLSARGRCVGSASAAAGAPQWRSKLSGRIVFFQPDGRIGMALKQQSGVITGDLHQLNLVALGRSRADRATPRHGSRDSPLRDASCQYKRVHD